MPTKNITLAVVARTHYGVDIMDCDAIAIEWSANILATRYGAEYAAKEWKRVNATRTRFGLYTTIPRFDSPMYATYFAKKTA